MSAEDVDRVPGGWIAEVLPTTPGWMRVPAAMTPDERASWITASVADLRRAWDADWRDDITPILESELGQAATMRGDDVLLDLLYWPFHRPLAARVGVRVGTSIPAQDWERVGFRTTSYDGADMGPGLQCVDTTTLREEDVVVTLVHAHYVFDDGTFSVVVTVEPTLDDVFAHMAAGLHGLICGLRVERPDGTPFVSLGVPGFTSSPTDLWQEADLD